VNVYRRMQTFTPEACKAAGPHTTRWNQSTTRRPSICLRLGVRVALAQPHGLPLTASMRRHPDRCQTRDGLHVSPVPDLRSSHS
jgi:hypothetical protein